MAAAKKLNIATEKPRTKTQLIGDIAEYTELPKKDVKAVLEALTEAVTKDLSKKGAGSITLPGIAKLVTVKKPAQPAIKNWKNPFTGEIGTKPAKKASVAVKARIAKALKDSV